MLMGGLKYQVRGAEAVKAFSRHLMQPYKPVPKTGRIAELEAEVGRLTARCAQLEEQLKSRH
jgi:hypothetical protein